VLRQVVAAAQPQIDTHTLAPGLYYLRLLVSAGEQVGRGQFVRE